MILISCAAKKRPGQACLPSPKFWLVSPMLVNWCLLALLVGERDRVELEEDLR